VLAYVFWHRPRASVAPDHYEASLAAFHETLRAQPPEGFRGSLAVRLTEAPWLGGEGPAFEDWYLVEDWAAVGRLNRAAVEGPRRTPHDAVALEAGRGAGGIYRRMLGSPRPHGARALWFSKPAGMPHSELGEALDTRLAGRDGALWQRQMVLGPAPEFCLLADADVELAGWGATAVGRTPVA
jgi:hypothetical protein